MKAKSVTGSGTETEAEVEESPTEIDLPEDDQLREALKALMSEEGLSEPRLLELVNVPRGTDSFESWRKSLYRFLRQKEGGRLNPQLRVRLINLCRDRLPNLDILTPDFYVGSEQMCAAMQRAASTFYSVRPDRFAELKKQAQGRFFLYKKPVSPVLSAWIIRSYCRIWATSAGFMMVAEYQDGSFRSKDIGSEVVHEFYVGTCTKKDGVLTLMLRHLANGAIKNIYFDNIGFDSTTKLVTGGYGIAVETCEAFTPGRLASSGCVLKRIPDSFTFGEISKLTNIVHRDDVDPVIVSHIFGS